MVTQGTAAVRVGVIGVGVIGGDHIRRLLHAVTGATVVAVADADGARAQAVAEEFSIPRTHASGAELIADPEVDAILVASWGGTHEEYVVAAIAAGKPVFCEKPLATTSQACLNILAAEVAAGRRLVQVGFMRQYDPSYRAVKAELASGRLGAPLLAHCIHRNSSVTHSWSSEMMLNDACMHEFNIVPWLLEDDVVATQVLHPRPNSDAPAGLADPLLVLMHLRGGAIADVEVTMNGHYGYDVRAEVVGERGTVALPDPAAPLVRFEGTRSAHVALDWRERFETAYDIEMQEWVDAVVAGTSTGPSAWEGYVATAGAEAAVASLSSGALEPVDVIERPALYS